MTNPKPTIIKNDHFPVGSYAWHEIKDKMLSGDIQILLGNHLQISDYSTEVKEYWLRVLALKLPSPMQVQPCYFSVKKGILYHAISLNWEQIRDLPLADAQNLQAKAYLAAILEIPKIRGMKKRFFDTQKFYDDVQKLFVEKGWIS